MTVVKINWEAGQLTPKGKQAVAGTLYEKGKSFLRAAAHLQKEGGYEFVILHLLCQGMEIILKSFLLFKDYDRYINQLRKISHNLEKLAGICAKEFGLKVGRKELIAELRILNKLYCDHILRYGYGSVRDIITDPKTINSGFLRWRLVASVRLANHLLKTTRANEITDTL